MIHSFTKKKVSEDVRHKINRNTGNKILIIKASVTVPTTSNIISVNDYILFFSALPAPFLLLD